MRSFAENRGSGEHGEGLAFERRPFCQYGRGKEGKLMQMQVDLEGFFFLGRKLGLFNVFCFLYEVRGKMIC